MAIAAGTRTRSAARSSPACRTSIGPACHDVSRTLAECQGPAKTLPDKRACCFRCIRPANGIFLVIDFPAGAADRNRQIRVFRHGVSAEAAGIINCFGPPGAERSGDHGNAIQKIECAFFEILARDIFECLPASQPADPVSNLYVSGNRADSRVHEVAHEFADRAGLDGRIRIDRNENAAGSFCERVRKRSRFAAIGLMNHSDGRVESELLIQHFTGSVGGTVIDNNHF